MQRVCAPLAAELLRRGITGLTIIPCGLLAAFPLSNILLDTGHTLGESVSTSVAPSARALVQSASKQLRRAGVYTLGNPQPRSAPLHWSEVEALSLAKLARRLNLDGYAKVQTAATRAWLIDALDKGYVVDASCHGKFDHDDFRKSVLVLARDQELSLGELLSYQIDLRGLRLLLLSACQTMLLDLQGAVNQVRSLTSGVLQSRAQAALGSLWPVNDLATYLLMVRFAQEWFPHMDTEPPACALARAQHWLRTITNRELSQWGTMNVSGFSQHEHRKVGEKKTDNLILEALGVSSERYDSEQANRLIRIVGAREDEPDKQPFQDPFYWAGFQITGW